MPTPDFGMAWRMKLQPASFRGAMFHVEVDSKAGGRREHLHEFPKRDIPYDEDMGRKARRFTVVAYIVQGPNEPDYQGRRDELIAAMETEGPGTLVHPTMGTDRVQPVTYEVTERRDAGGYAELQLVFNEAGQKISTGIMAATGAQVDSAANNASTAAAESAQSYVTQTPGWQESVVGPSGQTTGSGSWADTVKFPW